MDFLGNCNILFYLRINKKNVGMKLHFTILFALYNLIMIIKENFQKENAMITKPSYINNEYGSMGQEVKCEN